MIRTISGETICTNMVCTICGQATDVGMRGTVFSNDRCTDL